MEIGRGGMEGCGVVEVEQQQLVWSEEESRPKLVVLKTTYRYYGSCGGKGAAAAAGVRMGGEYVCKCRPKLSVVQLN